MVDVNFSLGKRSFVWISLLVFFVGLGFVFAYSYAIPNSGHGGTGIFVSVNGNYLELQDAISGGEFSGNYVGGGNGVGLDHGHSASDVFVRVNGVDKVLQDAIDDRSLCLFGGAASGSYSGSDYLGHKGEDILIDFSGEKNLQRAINSGNFAGSGWTPSRTGVCAGTNVVQTRCGASRTVTGTKNCADTYGATSFKWYTLCNPWPDTCDGLLGPDQWYTCPDGVSKTCQDSYLTSVAHNNQYGDTHCYVRQVICRG